MNEGLWDLFVNLVAAGLGGGIAWSWQKLRVRQRRYQRLREIQMAATTGEVAICVRVGGFGDPVPDVLKYLRTQHSMIRRLIAYRVSAEEAEAQRLSLDSPFTAQRIIEDICEGIRAYGKEEVTRVHFFPAGMLVYPVALGAMLGNWCPVVVYHRKKDTYAALYEIDKDWIQKGSHDFPQLKAWEIITIEPAAEKTVIAPTHKEQALSSEG